MCVVVGVLSNDSVCDEVSTCVILDVEGMENVGVTGGVGGGVTVVVTGSDRVGEAVWKVADLVDGGVDEWVGVGGRDLL